MILIGDIGNTEIKIALYSNSKKLIKNKRINTNFINKQNLNSNFRFLNKYLNSIEKILFCSVVPKKFVLIKNYLSKKNSLKFDCARKKFRETSVEYFEGNMMAGAVLKKQSLTMDWKLVRPNSLTELLFKKACR